MNLPRPKPTPEHGEVALAGLELLAAFAQLQEAIGWLAREWIGAHQPEGRLPLLERADLRTLRDEDRVELVIEIAQTTAVDLDLSEMKGAFWRAKSTRDLFAHSFFPFYDADPDGTPTIGFPYYYGDPRVKAQDGNNTRFTARKIEKRIKTCLWLLDIVEYIRQNAGYSHGPIWQSAQLERPPARAKVT